MCPYNTSTMWQYWLMVFLVVAHATPFAWAQNDDTISPQEIMMIFVIFIVAVIVLFLYLARDSIRRIRTDYDQQYFESKENRDYEKYHSGWQDDYEEYNPGKHTKNLPDYYKILGVSHDATLQEIKSRYRQLVRSRHPDVSGEDSDTDMVKINEAYEVLSDKDRRDKYDLDIGARGEI